MELDALKWSKKGIIFDAFKLSLETTLTTAQLPTITLVVGTTNDKNAYTDVWFSLLNDTDKSYIKDRNGQMAELTKVEIHIVISKMIDTGKALWAKKEVLLTLISDATTIEELEAVVW